MNNEDSNVEIKKEPPFLKRIKLLDEKVAGLEEKLVRLLDALGKIEVKTYPKNDQNDHLQTTPEPVAKTETQKTGAQGSGQTFSQYPVPFEYREIINTVLNGQFGIRIEPMPDRPAFQLQIIVPEKYSNMSLDEKKTYKVDIRTRIIGYAEGANGVRQYAELVANNLGPEIRAMIITDRANLV